MCIRDRGDTVRWRNLEFAVEEVRRRRVTRVRLRLLGEAEDAAAASDSTADSGRDT